MNMTKALSYLTVLMTVASLTGCTGLQQFPDTSKDYAADLETLDPNYVQALKTIYAGTLTPKQVRNQLIDTRLAVLDEHYEKFEAGLTKDNVRVELGVALVGVGVGGVGSFVSETASQILSAVSGGLAGASSAYGKAVLYDNTLKALIAQMRAGRAVIRAQIFQRWDLDTNAYPLWLARQDLEAYQFAGSLPGAILATSADAKEKQDTADAILLAAITPEAVTAAAFKGRADIMRAIDGLDLAKAQALVALMEKAFPSIKPFVDAQYTPAKRAADTNGAKARLLLKRMVSLTALTSKDMEKWGTAISSL